MQSTSDPVRREVTPLELFFDLVYVFAIGQLSHQLLAHPTWTGAAQTLVLYLAVYAAWAYTTWAVTLVPAEDPRSRRMLLTVMLLGLFMNAAIPRAFGDAGWVFVATFLLIHLGRTGWLLTVGLDRREQEHWRRVLVWFAAAAPLWLTGAAADGGARLTWWAAATLVELAGTWTAHPLPGRRLDSRQVTFAGGHLLERGRLFMIIAFGETILTTGTALTKAPYAPMTLLTAGVALTGTVALFWLFFSRSEHIVRHYERTEDPIRAGRSGVYSLMVSVAGMIAAAAGDERVIAHPAHHAGITTNLLLFGGPALFIGAQTWHGRTLFDDLPKARLLALSALILGCAVTTTAPAYLAAVIAAAIVVTLAALEDRRPPGDAAAEPVSSSRPRP
ncbi:low temperature requirement protein A [Streptomyces stelliscabiei]|uniref:low temperature requirement protein A n=1 Tax=Streptomyces stelliscabiei TaxID=146820 RepID=UPI0029AC28C6|nr:low temperature requirement protein A [Streptomyces stelliscabiei]MDX2557327.1 low temperature requirement protein A [Streptomyces stelliscabiei]MDX2616959.1 low temperature requirement protein A [Streptomyces stelliscabiei]MDX2641323.1 low temperature requirement protein A [Streptomyces stelliscabiei]MDX2665490.1 low temperature requirement protein A [Streptomyces stelliscabiei]MDX2715121.1 low temperature requirement protein A [Streptomyces stelliscabiei]